MSTSKDCVEWTLEWTLDAEESEMRPSFRHLVDKTKTGLLPLALYVNDVLVDRRYAFRVQIHRLGGKKSQ